MKNKKERKGRTRKKGRKNNNERKGERKVRRSKLAVTDERG